jgi:RHH-type transcriptional regulator, rel operon repressor / antitoxin RelB
MTSTTAERFDKTLNIRLPRELHTQLAMLTHATGRTKSYLAIEALETYLDYQSWQISELQAGLDEARRGDFATKDAIDAVFAKYGA